MSRENLEVFQLGVDAWNAGDLDTLAELYDPAVVMYHWTAGRSPGPPWDEMR